MIFEPIATGGKAWRQSGLPVSTLLPWTAHVCFAAKRTVQRKQVWAIPYLTSTAK